MATMTHRPERAPQILTWKKPRWFDWFEPFPDVIRYQPARGVTRDTKDTFHIPVAASPTDCEWIIPGTT
jgi:hypothetical protein